MPGILASIGDLTDHQGEFYTEGSDDLLLARRKLARYSLSRYVVVIRFQNKEKANNRARTRIAKQRIEVGLPLGKIVNARKTLYTEMKVSFRCQGSDESRRT